jgi:hypothetical protein
MSQRTEGVKHTETIRFGADNSQSYHEHTTYVKEPSRFITPWFQILSNPEFNGRYK